VNGACYFHYGTKNCLKHTVSVLEGVDTYYIREPQTRNRMTFGLELFQPVR